MITIFCFPFFLLELIASSLLLLDELSIFLRRLLGDEGAFEGELSLAGERKANLLTLNSTSEEFDDSSTSAFVSATDSFA